LPLWACKRIEQAEKGTLEEWGLRLLEAGNLGRSSGSEQALPRMDLERVWKLSNLLSHFGRVKTLAFQATASAEVSEA
jgi:hypothetical protein